MRLALHNPKSDIWRTRTKRSFTPADVQDALAGFVQAGLIREFPVAIPASTVDRKKRFGKRERALIKEIIKRMLPRLAEGGTVLYLGDAVDKFPHLATEYLQRLGVALPAPTKMPDVVVHDTRRNWLLLIEAVTSAGPIDGKRRKELKELFKGCKAGLVFVTAFFDRASYARFGTQISWETEVWIADAPDHIIHFNGERFLGPYPDVMPKVD